MQLISNTCIASYIQRDCIKQPYNNPFCWNIIHADSMFNLIKNYDKIDFNNYDLVKDDKWNFSIIIDRQVKVNYVHYLFSANDTVIRKNDVDVFYNKIWEYIVEKYETRVKRFLTCKENPTFIVGTTWPGNFYTRNEIEKIVSIETPYNIIIANNNIVLNTNKHNVHFHKTSLLLDNAGLAKELYDHFKFA